MSGTVGFGAPKTRDFWGVGGSILFVHSIFLCGQKKRTYFLGKSARNACISVIGVEDKLISTIKYQCCLLRESIRRGGCSGL